VEVKTENTIIKVDNGNFVMDIGAHPLLETLVAQIECAIDTGAYKELVLGNMMLMHSIIKDKKKQEEQDDKLSCDDESLLDDITDKGSW